MLYDTVCNQPYSFFRDCHKSTGYGVPAMGFKPRHMKQAVSFRIDEVAKLYFNHYRDDFDPAEFHNVAPRYPIMWFEFANPVRARQGDDWIDYEATIRDTLGDKSFDITKTRRGIYVRSWDRFDPDQSGVFTKHVPAAARWVFRSMIFMSRDDKTVEYGQIGLSWAVDGRGRAISLRDESRPYYFSMPTEAVGEVGAEAMRGLITGSMIPVFMTLALIHCANVSVIACSPRKARFKSGSRRARRLAGALRRDESFKAHHVIEVNSSKTVRRGSGSTGRVRASAVWHQVPGQFRHYDGKVNPDTGRKNLLFGRQQGTFYVPAYHRGTKEAGRITKEYEVKADV